MRRNFKEKQVIAVSLESYLSRRNITSEQLVKGRNLRTVDEINNFLSKIGVKTLSTVDAKKILNSIKQNNTLSEISETTITNNTAVKQNYNKKTQSSKLMNNTKQIDNSSKELDKISKTLETNNKEK